MKTKRPVIDIHTDGSFKGNPKVGGYSGVMVSGSHAIVIAGRDDTAKDNDQMELQAVLSCLRQVNTPARIHISSDSQYVVNGINSWSHSWKQNGWKTQKGKDIAYKETWQELVELRKDHLVKATWVKGHTKNPTTQAEMSNHACDELAQLAAEGKL